MLKPGFKDNPRVVDKKKSWMKSKFDKKCNISRGFTVLNYITKKNLAKVLKLKNQNQQKTGKQMQNPKVCRQQ